jgi:uncharacterized circularly permuted ATP-grasp superfamily protein
MADVLSDYRPGTAFDEMVDRHGEIRPSYRAVYATLQRSTPKELQQIADSLANNYTRAGVTFDVGGVERPFPLDLVPRVIAAAEWEKIESGVAQRVKTLEAFLADVYSERRVISDGVIPSQLVTSSNHYHRAVWGAHPSNGVRIHVAGVDLIRNVDGDVRVLEDNVRVPSGVSYVMTNRSAMITALPDAFSNQRIRPVAGYPQRLLNALRKSAPPEVDQPTVVVLTPGVYNSAYFEHTLLARTMGVELVEGRDLECRRGKVFMRTTSGSRKVDVIYRRIDDDYIDPLVFRADSMLGVPGLIAAYLAGNVTLANAPGTGIADDKAIYSYMPEIVKYYTGGEAKLPNVQTFRCREKQALQYTLDHLPDLVVKLVDGSGGYGMLVGPTASKGEIEAFRAALIAEPHRYIAQPTLALSTVPTLVEQGIAPRHVDFRPFCLSGADGVKIVPGGLTRVALKEGSLVVNSSQGGGTKDSLILSDSPRRRQATVGGMRPQEQVQG